MKLTIGFSFAGRLGDQMANFWNLVCGPFDNPDEVLVLGLVAEEVDVILTGTAD